MKKLPIAIAALVLALAPAAAQNAAAPRLSEACRTEVKNLCSAAQGKEARRACIKENRSKLSEGCLTELKARMEAHKAAKGRIEGQTQ